MRAGRDPFAELAARAGEYQFYTCGVVVVEVVRRIRTRRQREEALAMLDGLEWIDTTQAVWQNALQLAWELDARGQWTEVPDLTIAACALSVDAAVLTFDSDFDRVPGLRVIDRLA
jgi:predicted nucleic acid-binding protein